MKTDTIDRAPDGGTPQLKNIGWFLLPRRESSSCNLCVIVQRFDSGGTFEKHSHDLEQFFYILKGTMKITVGDETGVFNAGDFVAIERNQPHSGRNLSDGTSELLAVDYWPADSDDRIGLD